MRSLSFFTRAARAGACSSPQKLLYPLTQQHGLHLGGGHWVAYIQAHTVEHAAPERPHHGAALLDAAEVRAPQVGQRHGDHGHVQAVGTGTVQDLDDAALEGLQLPVAGDAALGEDGQQVALAQHLGGTLEGGLVGLRVFPLRRNRDGLGQSEQPAQQAARLLHGGDGVPGNAQLLRSSASGWISAWYSG